MQYKTGDVVVKCGENVPMTVDSVDGEKVTCVWFPKDESGEYHGGLQRDVISAFSLEMVKAH